MGDLNWKAPPAGHWLAVRARRGWAMNVPRVTPAARARPMARASRDHQPPTTFFAAASW